MISDDRAEKAVEFFRDNACDLAAARAKAKYLDHKRKVIRSISFADRSGTIAEREAWAESSEEYIAILEEYRAAVYEAERLSTLLKGAELTIEVWRTQNANNRKAHV